MRRFFSLDAIVRTTWRMLVTRTRLLEWNPVERALESRSQYETCSAYYRTMWIAPGASPLLAAIYLAISRSRRADGGTADPGPLVCCLPRSPGGSAGRFTGAQQN